MASELAPSHTSGERLRQELDAIFNPRSIAVVGASPNPRSSGHAYLKYQLDFNFPGALYPVNPNATEVLGLPAYPDVLSIPGEVDFVISCVPAAATVDVVEQCIKKGVKGIHLFTGRFSETGRDEGRLLEEQIRERVRAAGVRIIGPNCFGIYNPAAHVSCRSSSIFPREPGKAAFLSQSGGLLWDLLLKWGLFGVRFSKAVSYGNALDLNETDFLEYFLEDPQTEVIGGYIEGVRDGRRFMQVLKRTAMVKPVVMLKGGHSAAGASAAASHTASLAGANEVFEAALRQAGAVTVDTPDELADMLIAFNFMHPGTGNRAGIVGGGGGHSVSFADVAEAAGLTCPPLPDEMREEMKRQNVPVWDWLSNPADTSIAVGSNATLGNILDLMSRSDAFDTLVPVLGDWHLETEAGKDTYWRRVEEVVALAPTIDKPMAVVLWWNLTGEQWRWETLVEARRRLTEAGVAIYPTVEQAVRALRRFTAYHERRGRLLADGAA